MGIHRAMARLILHEAASAPVKGSVLLIGRQTVHLTPAQALEAIRKAGLTPKAGVDIQLDCTTRNGAGRGLISDLSFFELLGADEVHAIDVTDYEGADLLHDLNRPLPLELQGRFDFIVNGSVLDNVFDPATGLKNISRMLAPGGRVIHFEHASNAVNNAYLQFSPNWFFDYFVVNGYADCKPYLALFDDLDGPWDYFACPHDDDSEPRQLSSSRLAMTAVIAESRPGSTWEALPVQGQYRVEADRASYNRELGRLMASSRPWLGQGTGSVREALLTSWCSLLQSLVGTRHGGLARRAARALACRLLPSARAIRQGYIPLGRFR